MANKRARKAAAARKRAAAAAAAAGSAVAAGVGAGALAPVPMECCAAASELYGAVQADEATLSTLPSTAAALRAALHGSISSPVGACDAAGRRMAAFGTAPGLGRLSAEELRLASDLAYRQCRDTLVSPYPTAVDSARARASALCGDPDETEPFTYARRPRVDTPGSAAVQFAGTCRLPVLGCAPSATAAASVAADHGETFAFAVPARNEPNDVFVFHVVAPANGWASVWNGTDSFDICEEDEVSIPDYEDIEHGERTHTLDTEDDVDTFRRMRDLKLALPGEVEECDFQHVQKVLESSIIVPPRTSSRTEKHSAARFKQQRELEGKIESPSVLEDKSLSESKQEAQREQDVEEQGKEQVDVVRGLDGARNDDTLGRVSSGSGTSTSNKEDEIGTPTGSSLWTSFGRLFSFARSPVDSTSGTGSTGGSGAASANPASVPVSVPLPTAVSDTGPLATSPTTPQNCASEEERAQGTGVGRGSRRVLRAARTLKQPPSSPRDNVADPTAVSTLSDLRERDRAVSSASLRSGNTEPERTRRKKVPKVKRRPRVRLVPEDEDENTTL